MPEEIGRAEIDVGADTSGFPEEVKRGVKDATDDLDPELKRAGDEWGRTLSHEMGERLKKEAPKVGHDLEDALSREKITSHVKAEVDVDYDKDEIGAAIHRLIDHLESGLISSGTKDTFGKAGQTIGSALLDGVGSIFNVSGKSPLAALLIPVLGGLAGLIGAAIESAFAAGGAVLTFPTILSAIIVQAGVLYLIFKDLGPIIQAAFAAKNPQELAKALKNVAEPIAEFVRELIEWRDFLKQVGGGAAIQFFTALGKTLQQIGAAIGPTFFAGVLEVAKALGEWFNTVGKVFQSKVFVTFLDHLFDSITKFLDRNGPMFAEFLEDVIYFLDQLIGPANDVGALFGSFLVTFGRFLVATANSKGFKEFMERLPLLLITAGDAAAVLLDLVLTIFQEFDKAGGLDFLEFFIFTVSLITRILESRAGIESLKVLIFLLEVLFASFLILVVAIVAVFSALYDTWMLILLAGKAIGEFFQFLVQLWDLTVYYVGKALEDTKERIVQWGKDIRKRWDDAWAATVKWFKEDLPRYFHEGLDWILKFMEELGRNAVKAFFGSFTFKKEQLHNVAAGLAEELAAHLPRSPAKKGPFSGSGAPMARGQKLVSDLARGIMSGLPALDSAMNAAVSNVNFGPGAVNANFYGSNPTPNQARELGEAVGSGLGDVLAARNTRLAVRSM